VSRDPTLTSWWPRQKLAKYGEDVRTEDAPVDDGPRTPLSWWVRQKIGPWRTRFKPPLRAGRHQSDRRVTCATWAFSARFPDRKIADEAGEDCDVQPWRLGSIDLDRGVDQVRRADPSVEKESADAERD
jgi:hypothetical protein